MRGVLRSLAVAAVGAALLLGGQFQTGSLNLAGGATPAPAPSARVAPVTRAQAICPGPERLGVVGGTVPPAQTVGVTAVAAPAAALPSVAAASPRPGSLTISGLPVGGAWPEPSTVRGRPSSAKVSGAQAALAAGEGGLAPGTVATQRSWVKNGDNRALVTAACMPAAASSWLIAGGAEPGRRLRLVLTNPGANPVTVDLDVIGATGPVESPNGRALVVGPYARLVVPLDAIAGSEPSPAVHVSARGGEVAAVLSDSWLDGVVPRGGDDAVPVAGPSREQVIVGVPVQGGATLRVAVPGAGPAVVQSRVLTASGPKALPSNGVVRLSGRSSKDIDLSSLPPGAYAVQVRADVPVVAGATVERRITPGGPSDLAWSGASAPIGTLAGMALRGPFDGSLNVRLDLAATGDAASVMVTTVGVSGEVSTKKVAIAADSELTVSLGAAASVWVTPRKGVVRAAVVTWGSDIYGMLLSVTPLDSLPLTATSLPLRELPD